MKFDAKCVSFADGGGRSSWGAPRERKMCMRKKKAAVWAALLTGSVLLTAGGEIIWAIGLRRSALYQVDETTTTILELRYEGEET